MDTLLQLIFPPCEKTKDFSVFKLKSRISTDSNIRVAPESTKNARIGPKDEAFGRLPVSMRFLKVTVPLQWKLSGLVKCRVAGLSALEVMSKRLNHLFISGEASFPATDKYESSI
jgi:hypothetical protein